MTRAILAVVAALALLAFALRLLGAPSPKMATIGIVGTGPSQNVSRT
jgi:hypothetical protein